MLHNNSSQHLADRVVGILLHYNRRVSSVCIFLLGLLLICSAAVAWFHMSYGGDGLDVLFAVKEYLAGFFHHPIFATPARVLITCFLLSISSDLAFRVSVILKDYIFSPILLHILLFLLGISALFIAVVIIYLALRVWA